MKDTLVTPADATPEDSAPEGQVSDNSLSKERKLEISDAKKVKHEQTDPIRTDLMSEVGFNSFIKKIKSSANKRKDQRFTKKEDPNLVKKFVEDLFEKRGSTDEFRHHLSLVTKTGNRVEMNHHNIPK